MNTMHAVMMKVKFTFDVNGKIWDVAFNKSTGLWYINEVLSEYKIVRHSEKDGSLLIEAQKVLQYAVEAKKRLSEQNIKLMMR